LRSFVDDFCVSSQCRSNKSRAPVGGTSLALAAAMLSTHVTSFSASLGRLSSLVPLLAVCGACSSSDPEMPLTAFGGQSSVGSSGTASGGATSGTPVAGGTFGTAGTFGTGGTFGNGGTPGVDTAGTTSGGGSPSDAGTSGVGGGAAGSEAGGVAGTAPVGCGKSTGADPLIDDFEDADTTLKLVDGRNGPWETFDDGTIGGVYAGKMPTAGTGRGGTAGFCTSITGYKAWGANLVASMNAPKCGYDASSYDGVCFWAKGKVTAGGPFVFAVGTSDTVPNGSGGMCTLQGRCNSHYEANPVLEEADYKQYCYKWSELKSPNIPTPPAFASAGIVQIEWKFPAANAKSTDGNFCVDDVAFCKGDACKAN
jgi:hypothetical protein